MGDAYPAKILVAVNEKGCRIGQDNPAAVLTDHEVDIVFELREEGWGYGRIAKKMEVSKSLIRDIVKGTARFQHAVSYKVVVEG